jgi:hypothetical protein
MSLPGMLRRVPREAVACGEWRRAVLLESLSVCWQREDRASVSALSAAVHELPVLYAPAVLLDAMPT